MATGEEEEEEEEGSIRWAKFLVKEEVVVVEMA